MSITIKPIIRKDAILHDGTTRIYIRIIINRSVKVKATDFYISAKNWDATRCEVKKSQTLSTSINLALRAVILRMYEKAYELIRTDTAVTHEKVMLAMNLSNIHKFKDYSFNYIDKREGITKRRKTVLKIAVEHVESFRKGLALSDVSPKLIQDFKQHLKGKGYSVNYQVNLLGRIRTILAQAKLDGAIKDNPFESVAVGSYKTRKDFFSYNELLTIINNIHKLSEAEKHVVDRFCFCCCTGFRYSDCEALDYSNLRKTSRGYFFYIDQQKTDEPVIVPLSNLAEQFLQLNEVEGRVFKSFTNQYCNRALKSAFKKIGIERNITTHIARHSFITISQELGMDRNAAGKIAGQMSEKTTAGYSHYNLDMLFTSIEKWNNAASGGGERH